MGIRGTIILVVCILDGHVPSHRAKSCPWVGCVCVAVVGVRCLACGLWWAACNSETRTRFKPDARDINNAIAI